MELDYVPLLKIQRELYELPRGMERFQAYIATMVDAETSDLKLPLAGMNPMGKDHLPALLDEYLAMDADGEAARATASAASRLLDVPGDFKVTLVLSDDAMGGWTNRYASEYAHCFGSRAYDKRGWLTGILWTSEPPSAQAAREEALRTVYRRAHIERHGYAKTLKDMMRQEGYAMAAAGCTAPRLEADDLAYTREVITPFADSTDYPLHISCLYGDEGAASLGYSPQGLSPRAGLALALYDARK